MERRALLAAGDPDFTLGQDGHAGLSYGGPAFVIADSAVAPDGKIVLGGTKGTNLAVVRLRQDGTPDPSFSGDGLYESSVREQVTSLAVQGDGKIVIGMGRTSVYEHRDLEVGRLLANGAGFDPDFGTNGIAHAGRETFVSSAINDVAIQRDGKIIGAGALYEGSVFGESEFAVVRYDATGSLDGTFNPGFNSGGVMQANMGSTNEAITAVTIDYNGDSTSNPGYGSIVAVGGENASQPGRFQVLRLLPNGFADVAFDGDGKLTSPNLSGAGVELATDVVVQPGGKVVVAGTALSPSDPSQKNFLVARYTPSGALDPSFGLAGGGVTELDLGGRDEVGAVAVGYHNVLGNLVVAGSRNGQFAMVGLLPNGQLDTRFSGDGILTTSIFGHATGLFATGGLFPPVRKLVIAGGNGQVARYVDVGSLISVGTLQPQMYEQGEVPTSFLVTRTVALPFAETIILSTSGNATTLGADRDFNGTNILFGNGQTTSTEVTIPAGATSITATLKPIDDVLVEGDETIGFTVHSALTYDASLTHTTTLVVRDNDTVGGPVVTGSEFNYETYPLNATITFNQSVVTSFTIGDLVINRTGGASPLYSLNYNNVTNTGTVVFYGGLVDGNYTVRVKASGINSVGGIPMASDYIFGFHVLAGDATRDAVVDVNDLNILATNWKQSGRTFSQGDLNYDNIVDDLDLGTLAVNWMKTPEGTTVFGAPMPSIAEILPSPPTRQAFSLRPTARMVVRATDLVDLSVRNTVEG